MRRGLSRAIVYQTLLGVLLVCAACHKAKQDPLANLGPPEGVGPGMMGGPPGMPGPSTPIRQVMGKLTKGPESLTSKIGQELDSDPPAWETIQPQTKEYKELAATLSKYDPPRGSKESWAKLTGSYTETAAKLDRAAAAKDKKAALAAHTALTQSCMECHREHRMMVPPGKMGPMSFGPSGGPPGPQQ
jgi:hypothetical protein